MALPLTSEFYTAELTNTALTITQSMGVRAVSITCTTATTGTVEGGQDLPGFTAGPLTVVQNQSLSFTASESSVIDGLVITAPAGCTLQVIAEK